MVAFIYIIHTPRERSSCTGSPSFNERRGGNHFQSKKLTTEQNHLDYFSDQIGNAKVKRYPVTELP